VERGVDLLLLNSKKTKTKNSKLKTINSSSHPESSPLTPDPLPSPPAPLQRWRGELIYYSIIVKEN
jgi:hypothetical protein